MVKNSPATQEIWVRSLSLKDPWKRERLPTPVFWPREFHGLYSPWDRKESDMTERLSLTGNIDESKNITVEWEKLQAAVRFRTFLCVHTQSCLIICNPMDCSPPGSSVHRILQARILQWFAHFLLQGIFLTQGSNPISPVSPALASRFFTSWAKWKPQNNIYVNQKATQILHEHTSKKKKKVYCFSWNGWLQ